jgi:hypothetical protein
MSANFRTKEECEKDVRESIKSQELIDRCVLQPPITLGWIEWEWVFELSGRNAPSEPIQHTRWNVITQGYGECRRFRESMRLVLEKDREPPPAWANGRMTFSACKPVYIWDRLQYTPLQVSDVEGILVRTRTVKEGEKKPFSP